MRRITVVTYWDETEPPWDWGNVPWIIRILVRWAIVALGFIVAEWFVNWIWSGDPFYIGDWLDLLIASGIFVVVRAILRPILFIFSLPCLLITLGLFIVVINALILIFAEWVCDIFGVGFAIDGFWAALVGALVISAVSFVISRIFRRNPFTTQFA
jgi:putative membrane protein